MKLFIVSLLAIGASAFAGSVQELVDHGPDVVCDDILHRSGFCKGSGLSSDQYEEIVKRKRDYCATHSQFKVIRDTMPSESYMLDGVVQMAGSFSPEEDLQVCELTYSRFMALPEYITGTFSAHCQIQPICK